MSQARKKFTETIKVSPGWVLSEDNFVSDALTELDSFL